MNFERSLCMLDMSAIGLEEGGRQGTKPLTSNIGVYRCVRPPEQNCQQPPVDPKF